MNPIRNRRGFTLAELIVSIAILAFFSTVIVQVFAQAQAATERAEELDHAVVCVSDLADQWKSDEIDQMDPSIQSLWTSGNDENKIVIYFNDAFFICPQEEASYQAEMITTRGSEPHFYELSVIFTAVETAEPIYQLIAGRYSPQRGGTP